MNYEFLMNFLADRRGRDQGEKGKRFSPAKRTLPCLINFAGFVVTTKRA
ncbi:hypothetical protein GXM_01399 [Nostoc sphaeroides CCNUC1]|uniref:Uncharacterized protein n=1 Tax=Nostoc sphaeroides CCNUC1 TaxID=2653204 RepID=A0A5P8VUV9_9NOSO|nr:hypothetical protein GXM_01399 [Nostoc sphaeroides CCNUC1]